MKRIILCVVFLAALLGVSAKRSVDIDLLKNVTKKVYVSVEVQSMFNFLEGLKLPHKNNGITFCVTPSIRVDYYLGSYFFVGGGLSFNTAGGRYDFASSRIDSIPSGFTSSGVASRTMSISYIEMPIYVKVQSNYMNNWAVQGLLGFSWGVKVISSYRDVYPEFTYTNSGHKYLDGKYEERGALGKKASLWTVSGIIEIRALYRSTDKLQLFVGAGYQAGLVNMLSKKHANNEEFHNGKPGQVVVSAGIVF